MNQQGRLILLPVPIGADDLTVSLPAYNLSLMNNCHTFIVEELRTARRFLKHAGYPHPIDDTTFHLLNEHTSERDIEGYLEAITLGQDIGLLSEAGLPCVADPGMLITRMAQRRGIRVVPLVGPSSLMLALMASGMSGQHFAFKGYLPVDRHERAQAIKALELRARKEGETQIFIEAPYRNNQMLEALSDTLSGEMRICVATDLTLDTQYIRTHTAAQWRKERTKVNLHKRNTVFLVAI